MIENSNVYEQNKVALCDYLKEKELWDCFPGEIGQIDTIMYSIAKITKLDLNSCEEQQLFPILYAYINASVCDENNPLALRDLMVFLQLNFAADYKRVKYDMIEKIVAFSLLNHKNHNFTATSYGAMKQIKELQIKLFH